MSDKMNIEVTNTCFLSQYNNEFVTFGEYTYSAAGNLPKVRYFRRKEKLVIGNFCSIGPGVVFFLAGNHATDSVSTYPFCSFGQDWKNAPGEYTYSKGDIYIGHDVWIGSDVLILSGVTIGNGAIIGARTVVTKDIPPYAIVGGSPQQIRRYRFEPKLAWWNWPKEKIQENIQLIAGNSPEALLAKYEEQLADA